MIFAGIDAGSRAVKAVLWDDKKEMLLASAVADQGIKPGHLAKKLFSGLLKKSGLRAGSISGIVATGYARNMLSFADAAITEITCHAAGIHKLMPEARTIIEIGGQDSKILRLREDGALEDFAMNDRCAAGTGRFLEVVARQLESSIERLGVLASRSKKPAAISSMCVVFAETEIIGLLSQGIKREDIIAGVQTAIAVRIAALAEGRVRGPVAFTGGVALVGGMDKALASALRCHPTVPECPQLSGALGAAIIAARHER
ncbi:MAG: hypothetical protein A2X49_02750 [Lentisphaerae bacterium GWF2_52_8]|nr:MAG: hypothetical protein A2X49_02750 [Lentisphaerae bacterium GWF2_52_8]